jgi:hypothetical protein
LALVSCSHRNYSLLSGKHARKEAEDLQDLCLFLCCGKGHDPDELVVIQVRSMGLNHSNICVVEFDKDKFKGVFFYEEVLQKLLDDAAKKELQAKQEKMKKFHQN